MSTEEELVEREGVKKVLAARGVEAAGMGSGIVALLLFAQSQGWLSPDEELAELAKEVQQIQASTTRIEYRLESDEKVRKLEVGALRLGLQEQLDKALEQINRIQLSQDRIWPRLRAFGINQRRLADAIESGQPREVELAEPEAF